MDLNAYIRIARRWFWLILLAAIVAGSAAYVIARTQPPVYRTSSLVQLGNYLELSDPNPGVIQSSAALAQTYVTLLKTDSILKAVVDKLQLSISTGALAGTFDATLVPNTSFLKLTVTYSDPVIASEVANELADQLIANSPTNLTKDQQQQIDILQNEIQQAQTQLQNDRAELRTIEDALTKGDLSDAEKTILTSRRSELTTEISTTQTNLASMSATLVQLQQRGTINFIRVVEKAAIPTAPFNTSSLGSNTVPATVVAAVLAFGAALLIEYLRDTLSSPAEIMPLLSVPLLGAIAPFGTKRSYKNKLITWTKPRSTISEAYRALRVNILFRDNREDDGSRVYVVTSPGPSEGKSLTTANLAITFAMTGMRVILVDADLRRPTVHQIFNVPNTKGVSSLWTKEESVKAQPLAIANGGRRAEQDAASSIIRQNVRLYLSAIIQKTEVPGLDVITAGPAVHNPAELLDMPQIHEMMHQLAEELQYDIILYDTPPVLVVTDASIVSRIAGGKVITVIESRRTRRGAAVRAIQQMTDLEVPVLGVVMNRLRVQDRDANYGYYYYYGYTSYSSDSKPQLGPGPVKPPDEM